MWVDPSELTDLATNLRAAHRQLLDRVPAAAASVEAARWECGAGDEMRAQVSAVLRRVEDARGLMAGCADASDHVAGEATELLEAMRTARDERVAGLQEDLREAARAGEPTGGLRAELQDVPPVPDLSWLGVVPDPAPPVLHAAPASSLLPPVTSPGGRFSVELAALDAVAPALDDLSLGVTLARLGESSATGTPLRATDAWGLGGGRLVEPIAEAYGFTGLGMAGSQLDGLAESVRVAAARIRRHNHDGPRLLAEFGDASGFSGIADELLQLRLAKGTPGFDLAEVTAQLQLARDAGMDPTEYRALLQQHWFLVACEEAGIDAAAWDIDKGAFANAETIEEVYAHYGRLFLENPELEWAGLANMVGAGFAAAFYDLDQFGQVADLASRIPGSPVGPLGELSESELRHYETMFLSMQKQIFTDIGSAHQAYADGGLAAVDEMRAAGLLDARTVQAFHDMARASTLPEGSPERQQLMTAANYSMAYREQGAVIGDDYDAMRNHFPSGPAFTYVAGLVGAPSVPGAVSPAQHRPLVVEVPLHRGPFGLGPEVDAEVTTPLPSYNVSHFGPRMELLADDTLPAYERLLRERGVEQLQAEGLISDDPEVVRRRIEEYRTVNRLDELAEQLTRWDVDVDVDW